MQLIEEDDAGNVTAIYDDGSSSGGSDLSEMRADIIVSKKEGKSRWHDLASVFLPAGYPHSVTDDYLEYQIYVCFLHPTHELS